VQQARIEALLQAVHVLADRGLRHGERIGGFRETAEVDHAHEDGDVG
jgi:hypothetical protein